jgi:hypothetical protein
MIPNALDIAGEPATVLKPLRHVPAGFHGDFVAARSFHLWSLGRVRSPFLYFKRLRSFIRKG